MKAVKGKMPRKTTVLEREASQEECNLTNLHQVEAHFFPERKRLAMREDDGKEAGTASAKQRLAELDSIFS